MRIGILCIFVFSITSVLSQVNTDSCMAVWQSSNQLDTNRLNAVSLAVTEDFYWRNEDTAIIVLYDALDFSRKRGLKSYQGTFEHKIARTFHRIGEYDSAITHFNKSISHYKSIKDDKYIGEEHFNLAQTYYSKEDTERFNSNIRKAKSYFRIANYDDGFYMLYTYLADIKNESGSQETALLYLDSARVFSERLGDLSKTARTYSKAGLTYDNMSKRAEALDAYKMALKYYEEAKDYSGQGGTLVNIGNLFDRDQDKALEYFYKSIPLHIKSGNKRFHANTYTNIGYHCMLKKDYDSAYVNLYRAAQMHDNLGSYSGLSITLNILGTAYMQNNEIDSARALFQRTFNAAKSANSKPNQLNAIISLSRIEKTTGNYRKGIEHANVALQYAKELNSLYDLKRAYKELFVIHDSLRDYKNAYQFYREYVSVSDSFTKASNLNDLYLKEQQFKFEKQAAADSIKAAEAIKISNAQAEVDKERADRLLAEAKSEEYLRYILFAGLGLVVVFAFIMYNRFRITNKQKGIIEEQKQKVDLAYDQLEEKNTEILDSINYAKRIQSAILPADDVLKQHLNDVFVLYKPKDIVAGDFYWMENIGDSTLIAAADCTGHGVPGAMVSVVCHNALNRSVREFGLSDPAKILDKTRELVVAEFEKGNVSASEIKDGMDIALCNFNNKTGELSYAGAYNPLWIVRNEHNEIEEVKADKQPIGQYEALQPFTSHKLMLNKGDHFYLFTDGFADQFGGDESSRKQGKKLKAKNFKKILESFVHLPLDKQKQSIDDAFEKWRGDFEQLDDVCMIGVRV